MQQDDTEKKLPVLVTTLEPEWALGPLAKTIEFLQGLAAEYGRDYQDLVIGPNGSVTGVAAYSDETLTKIAQVENLVASLPDEAALCVLNKLVVGRFNE